MGEAVAVTKGRDAPAEPHPRRWRAASRWLPEAAILAAAAILSFPRLGARTLWLDEAYTVGATNELFDTWRNTAATQALYYLLVWPVTRLSTDPVWLRLPSAVLGLAALVVVLRLGERIGGRRVALLATGGLALSWGLARYAVEARSYMLALVLVSTTWLALVGAVQDDDDEAARRRWWRIFTGAHLLIPLTHGLATLSLPAQLAAILIAPGDRRRLLRRAGAVAPVVGLELAALFLLGAGDVGDWVPPLSLAQVRGVKRLLLGFGPTGAVLAVLVAVAVVSTAHRFLRERTREAWIQVLPVFWGLGPPLMVLALSLFRPYLAARYVYPCIPAFFLLLAGLLVRLGSTRRVALVSVPLALLLLVDQRHVTTNGIEDWSELTACIADNAADGDRLVTAAAFRSALDYYWTDHPELDAVEPLSPPEPLGHMQRIYESLIETRPDFRSILLRDTDESIWYVERGSAGHLSIVGLAFDERVTDRYTLTEPWFFAGTLTLVRLDPVDADRPRSTAPCETVATPADMRPR